MASLLMVDHALLFRLLESTCARRSGWSLRSAHTTDDLLEKARQQRPDVIVLSGVPACDATAAATRLRADASLKAVPILAIGRGADLEACARAGADAALEWPAAEAQLEASLADLMHEARRGARRRAARLPATLTTGEVVRRVWLRDIGPGGAFFSTPDGPAVDAVVEIALRLPGPDGSTPLGARGVVVRRVDEQPGSHRVAGVAVRFTDPDADRTRRLETFVRATPAPEA